MKPEHAGPLLAVACSLAGVGMVVAAHLRPELEPLRIAAGAVWIVLAAYCGWMAWRAWRAARHR